MTAAAARLQFFAPCARGLEPRLSDEIRSLHLRGVRPQRGGVLFAGSLAEAYRVLMWSRLASRVLLSLGEVDASSSDALYEGVRALPWEDHLRADGTLAVDAAGTNAALRDTRYIAVRVKDAVVDRFRDRYGRRPSVDTAAPELRINVVVTPERARLAIDLSGTPLHRRGYREQGVQVIAPMKETLAAAVLGFAGWAEMAERGGGFCDPLCGSGTLAIEAALIAGDCAPGLLRRSWGFDHWLGHDAAAWEQVRADAAERRAAGVASMPPVIASDADARAIEIARRFVRRAGLETVVRTEVRSLANAAAPSGVAHGLVAVNPPYGERLGDRRALATLYGELATVMRTRFSSWALAAITSDEAFTRALGARPASSYDVMNGRIPARIHVFAPLAAGGAAASRAAAPGSAATPAPEAPARDASGDRVSPGPVPGIEPFENRLRKMSKHFGTWARRADVSCYRVYDADLPDFNLAIDLYRGAGPDQGSTWVHLAEYAAPAHVDERRAAARRDAARVVAARVFGVSEDDVFVKRRERQRGSAQYTRSGNREVRGIVSEGGLLFEVNLSDYLDTGIFLDHRDTRAWLRELAAGRDILNLFAYTGTASVYAADGGARSTVTVDLSNTYIDWARRNMERNGFTGPAHEFVRADVLAWLSQAGGSPRRYGLIFCDPPTFSNSKSAAETFDVQRDHVELIAGAAALLTDDGLMVFSCNRRRFEMDVEALQSRGLVLRDVTRRTIPKDFERTPGAHTCWTVRRA